MIHKKLRKNKLEINKYMLECKIENKLKILRGGKINGNYIKM